MLPELWSNNPRCSGGGSVSSAWLRHVVGLSQGVWVCHELIVIVIAGHRP
jgi:hypothetical protein